MKNPIVDKTFIYFVKERERIRKAREAGLPRDQWTDDPILKHYRFCNVSREDDRMTKWIKKHIRDPFDQQPDDMKLFKAVALARFLNTDASLGVLVERGLLVPDKPIDLHAINDCVNELKKQRVKVFNAAYMVGAPHNFRSEPYGRNKIAYVCGVLTDVVMPPLYSRQAFVENLSRQFGFAEFMAGQVAADLAYTRLLRDAPDHLTWSPRGPGAVRGMNRALGRPLNSAISRQEYLEVGMIQMGMLPREIVEDRKLTLHDVASNVNCETDKYLRGGGHRKYK